MTDDKNTAAAAQRMRIALAFAFGRYVFVFAALLSTGCGDETPESTLPEVVYKHRLLPPLPAARELASPIGFDLIATSEGATLVYGPNVREGGGLFSLFLSPEGEMLGSEQELSPGRISLGSRAQRTNVAVEVSAAQGGGQLGVVWVSREGRQRVIKRGIGTVVGQEVEFGATATLGIARTEPEMGRSVGIAHGASESDAFSAMYPAGACESEFESCLEMHFSTFGIDSDNTAQGPTISIPAPCESPLRGLIRTSDGFDYAVCSGARGTPEVSIFTIDYEPEYARAESLFAGCRGRELGLLAGSQDRTHADFSRRALLANCDGAIAATVIWGDEQEQMEQEPKLDCVGDDLRWSVSGQVEHNAVWRVPASHLAGLLPYSLQGARDGVDRARAVWTGEALLVAYPQQHTLVMRRYVCIRGSLYHADGRGRVSARAPIAVGTPHDIAASSIRDEP